MKRMLPFILLLALIPVVSAEFSFRFTHASPGVLPNFNNGHTFSHYGDNHVRTAFYQSPTSRYVSVNGVGTNGAGIAINQERKLTTHYHVDPYNPKNNYRSVSAGKFQLQSAQVTVPKHNSGFYMSTTPGMGYAGYGYSVSRPTQSRYASMRTTRSFSNSHYIHRNNFDRYHYYGPGRVNTFVPGTRSAGISY